MCSPQAAVVCLFARLPAVPLAVMSMVCSRRSVAVGQVVVCEEGSGVVDTAEVECFSRSLKKLVGARDQVSAHSCVVARVLWCSGRLAG